ncbi:MAG: Integral membrane sensor signal transduction histidine kinase, partial [Candidatus Roizmanbacteria bacterium GW2011_GWA2_35_8]
MFIKARLKLTVYYLLIIMLISLFFSVVIYRNAINELQRIAQLQRYNYERKYEPLFYNSSYTLIESNLIEEAGHRIFISLVIINLSIFVFSAGFGYLLAGKTLNPIAIMIEEQNRFISDASHELKTPLTSLKSAFEVSLRDKKFDIKQAKELVAESIQEVDKLQILSENLLR